MKVLKWSNPGKPILLILIFILLTGCATTSFKSAPDFTLPARSQKILLMPMDVELSTLTAGGILKPEAEWTENARKNVEKALLGEMATMDIHLLCPRNVEGIALSSEEQEKKIQLIKLHEAVGQSILVHQYIPALKLPGKDDAFDWSLGEEIKLLKEKYGAQHALFVYMRDSYSSSGRVAVFILAAAFGASITMGQQVGFASLVDLDTGKVVWFNRLARGVGDLRTETAAVESIKVLLSNFPK